MVNQSAATAERTDSRSSAVTAAGLAIFVGLILVFAAGFVQSQVVHNAAHDSRHSLSFPCH